MLLVRLAAHGSLKLFDCCSGYLASWFPGEKPAIERKVSPYRGRIRYGAPALQVLAKPSACDCYGEIALQDRVAFSRRPLHSSPASLHIA